MALHDATFEKAVGTSKNMLVPWYLIASFAYYHLDNPVLSDSVFDQLCKTLRRDWEGIEHVHKYLVDYSCLKAGTNLSPKHHFPLIIRDNALILGC